MDWKDCFTMPRFHYASAGPDMARGTALQVGEPKSRTRPAIPALTNTYPEWPGSWRRLPNLTKSASRSESGISGPTIDRGLPSRPVYVKRVAQVALDVAA